MQKETAKTPLVTIFVHMENIRKTCMSVKSLPCTVCKSPAMNYLLAFCRIVG